ncbi:MAG: hypothetical protein CME59_10880 [Halioglobus sp.]|nr:hypothetical protein [Halioglobus sp.]
MKLKFLCHHHRHWLQDNPEMAVNTWLEAYDRALGLAQESDFAQAAAHAGCAMESAEIALSALPHPDARFIHRYAQTALMLARLLTRCGEREVARAVVGEAVGRMERLLVAGVERAAVLGACEELLRLGEDLPPTAGAHTTSKPGAHAPVYRLH